MTLRLSDSQRAGLKALYGAEVRASEAGNPKLAWIGSLEGISGTTIEALERRGLARSQWTKKPYARIVGRIMQPGIQMVRKWEREAATVKVTWRKVSAMTGGGWSGLGPNGRLVYVREPKTPRWDGAKYEYGTVDGKLRTACGGAKTLRGAKDKAAKLLEPA